MIGPRPYQAGLRSTVDAALPSDTCAMCWAVYTSGAWKRDYDVKVVAKESLWSGPYYRNWLGDYDVLPTSNKTMSEDSGLDEVAVADATHME